MKLAIVVLMALLVSCGRRNDNECRSKEYMRIQCQAESIPAYGRPYAVENCNRTYESDRCY